MSRLETSNDRTIPSISRVVTVVEGLTPAHLKDVTHDVNIKSISGKAKGMGCMIGKNIYIANGSEPDDIWVVFYGL